MHDRNSKITVMRSMLLANPSHRLGTADLLEQAIHIALLHCCNGDRWRRGIRGLRRRCAAAIAQNGKRDC